MIAAEDYLILLRIDDPEIATFVATHHGWACEVVDVGAIPFEVAAMVKHIERQQQGKPVEE